MEFGILILIWICSLVQLCSEILLMSLSKTSDHIQIKIKMPNPSQEPPGSSKTPNLDLEDILVLCTIKIRIDCQNLDHECSKDSWPYTNQDKDAKPKSGTSMVLQIPKSGLKGHGSSLHLQNQDREPKFGKSVYKRLVTTSKSRSRWQTPARNFYHTPKPK